MNATQFAKYYGMKGAVIRGCHVKNAPDFPRKRLCRICSEVVARCRVESLLLAGESILQIERSTTIPHTSISRHFRFCLSQRMQRRIFKARREKGIGGQRLLNPRRAVTTGHRTPTYAKETGVGHPRPTSLNGGLNEQL